MMLLESVLIYITVGVAFSILTSLVLDADAENARSKLYYMKPREFQRFKFIALLVSLLFWPIIAVLSLAYILGRTIRRM